MDQTREQAVGEITEHVGLQADILALCCATWAALRTEAESPGMAADASDLAAGVRRKAQPAYKPLERAIGRLQTICQACVAPAVPIPIPIPVRARREY